MKVSDLKARIDGLLEAGEISADDDVVALADEFDEFYQCTPEHVHPLDMSEEIAELADAVGRTKDGTYLHKCYLEKKAKYEALTRRCLVI